MKSNSSSSRDPDMIASLPALRRAARRALQVGLQTGTPVWVMEDGKIVDIAKRQQRKNKAPSKV